MPADQIQAELAALRQSNATAATLMTRPVITVQAAAAVRQAVAAMVQHDLKRLPVVDEAEHLVGIVSRIDIFRAVAYQQAGDSTDQKMLPLPVGSTVAELMYKETPTVSRAGNYFAKVGAEQAAGWLSLVPTTIRLA
ncbi:MAG: CBS domain-containing protein [Caldilineaceae bacterium]